MTARGCRFFMSPSTPPAPKPKPVWTPLPYLGWQAACHCNSKENA